ncbi:transglycosylase SLT domain-containing protein [Orbaceae bacterium ac157xtp]
MKKLLTIILISVLATACQSTVQKNNEINQDNNELIDNSITDASLTQDPWIFIQNQLIIDVPSNKRIQAEKEKLLKNKHLFEATLADSEPYIYYIVSQLQQRNMPVELALIPLIESAYNPLATSYSKAAGLWQIVPITARHYGLEKNRYYDPRRDLIESTETALNLLEYLNQRFDGDWLLTLAAYNAGEGRVKQAMKWNQSKKLPTHYWALNLSNETMRYVPKLLALIEIIRENEDLNVTLPACKIKNGLIQITLTKQISLDKIAQYSGIPLEKLMAYNAGYLKRMVKGPYRLFIPTSEAPKLLERLKQENFKNTKITNLLEATQLKSAENQTIYDSEITNNKYLAITDNDIHFYEQEHKRYSQIIYRIKSGDNLYSIAKKHKVKVSDLVKWNKIKNANKLKPGDKLAINIRNGSSR